MNCFWFESGFILTFSSLFSLFLHLHCRLYFDHWCLHPGMFSIVSDHLPCMHKASIQVYIHRVHSGVHTPGRYLGMSSSLSEVPLFFFFPFDQCIFVVFLFCRTDRCLETVNREAFHSFSSISSYTPFYTSLECYDLVVRPIHGVCGVCTPGIPCVTDCVIGELEKLGHRYRLALALAKDRRFKRLTCCHQGTYADDCIVRRVTEVKENIKKTRGERNKERRKRYREDIWSSISFFLLLVPTIFCFRSMQSSFCDRLYRERLSNKKLSRRASCAVYSRCIYTLAACITWNLDCHFRTCEERHVYICISISIYM